MPEIIQHAIGFCNDRHLHLDLTDALVLSGVGSTVIYLKYRALEIWESVKQFFGGQDGRQ